MLYSSDFFFQASNIRLGRNPLGPTPICQRCSILAIDNVTKEHLMELRIKDLRQYLESKRIPTAGEMGHKRKGGDMKDVQTISDSGLKI